MTPTETHLHIHEQPPADSIAAEGVLLKLAIRTRHLKIRQRYLPLETHVVALETRHNIASIRARLGEAYPQLTPEQDAAVVVRYANLCSNTEIGHLPTDQHNHDVHDDCGHNHGIAHKKLGKIERLTLGRLTSKRAQKLAAIAFRAISLLFCPGDDIAAIGLQIYGSVSGEVHDHGQAHEAILPGATRIELSKRQPPSRQSLTVV